MMARLLHFLELYPGSSLIQVLPGIFLIDVIESSFNQTFHYIDEICRQIPKAIAKETYYACDASNGSLGR